MSVKTKSNSFSTGPLKGKLYSINGRLRVTRFYCSYTGFLAWQQLGPYDELKFVETEHRLLYLELVYLYKTCPEIVDIDA